MRRLAQRVPQLLKRRQPFAFGFRYTHFWYALDAKPPFAIVGASPEFCLASPQDAAECESVQFISGLAHEAAPGTANHSGGPTLLLAYGVNDCEARVMWSCSAVCKEFWVTVRNVSNAAAQGRLADLKKHAR